MKERLGQKLSKRAWQLLRDLRSGVPFRVTDVQKNPDGTFTRTDKIISTKGQNN